MNSFNRILALSVLLSATAQAAVIDDFTTASTMLEVTAGSSGASNDAGTGILGGTRRVDISNTGAQKITALGVAATGFDFYSFDSEADTTGLLSLRYTQPVAVDLTMGGLHNAFEIVDIQLQGGVVGLQISLSDTANTQTIGGIDLSSNPSFGTPRSTSVRFALFDNVDLGAVTEIRFEFLAAAPGTDFALDLLGTTRVSAVPEPHVGLLLGAPLALLWARGTGRRQSRRRAGACVS